MFNTKPKRADVAQFEPSTLTDDLLSVMQRMGVKETEQAAWEVPLEHMAPDPENREPVSDEVLDELAKTLAREGQIQEIVVRPPRPDEDQSKLYIVAGEQRWRAAQRVDGMTALRALYRKLDELDAAILCFSENVHRENPSAPDLVKQVMRVRGHWATKYGKTPTQAELAEALSLSRQRIVELMALDACPSVLDFALETGVNDVTALDEVRKLLMNKKTSAAKVEKTEALMAGIRSGEEPVTGFREAVRAIAKGKRPRMPNEAKPQAVDSVSVAGEGDSVLLTFELGARSTVYQLTREQGATLVDYIQRALAVTVVDDGVAAEQYALD